MAVKYFLVPRYFGYLLLLPSILAVSSVLNRTCVQEEKLYQEVDFSKLSTKGIHVETITATNATNLQECGKACCHFKNCSLAQFNTNVKEYNCMIIYCEPIEMCITKSSNFISTVLMKSTAQSTSTEESNKETSHSGSVKPRKGVDLPPDGLHSSEEPKSSVPKGNVKLEPVQPTEISTEAKKPTPPPADVPIYPVSVNTTLVNHPDKEIVVNSTETKNSSKSIDKPKDEAKSNNFSELTPPIHITNSYDLPTTSESVPIKNNFPGSTTHLIMSNSSLQFGREGPRQKSEILGKTSLAEKESNSTTKMTPSMTTSSAGLSVTTMRISMENIENKALLTTKPNLPTTALPQKNQSIYITLSKDDADSLDQFLVTANIHLIIALVIGLLILLTVIGLILRRVHDVWQRRHYQRMDFLIDGMYNNTMT